MNSRRRFTPAQKVEILREHLENHVSVSDLCERHGIAPSQFYDWKKKLFEGALNTFAPKPKGASKTDKRLKKLQEKLTDRNSVISELLSENIVLKKNLGGED